MMKDSTLVLAAFLILLVGFFSVDNTLSGQFVQQVRGSGKIPAPNAGIATEYDRLDLDHSWKPCQLGPGQGTDMYVLKKFIAETGIKGEVPDDRYTAQYDVNQDGIVNTDDVDAFTAACNGDLENVGKTSCSRLGYIALEGDIYYCDGEVATKEQDCGFNQKAYITPDRRSGTCVTTNVEQPLYGRTGQFQS